MMWWISGVRSLAVTGDSPNTGLAAHSHAAMLPMQQGLRLSGEFSSNYATRKYHGGRYHTTQLPACHTTTQAQPSWDKHGTRRDRKTQPNNKGLSCSNNKSSWQQFRGLLWVQKRVRIERTIGPYLLPGEDLSRERH